MYSRDFGLDNRNFWVNLFEISNSGAKSGLLQANFGLKNNAISYQLLNTFASC
jgi:hypothetical protein